jgi:tetratricopeptide (TPR) repeat protein
MRRFAFSLLLSILSFFAFGSSLYKDASELYMNNQLKEALPLFEQVLVEEPRNELAYLYLSNCYESMNEFQKSIDLLERGLRIGRDYKYFMYYNMGNDYYIMGKYKLSMEMFSQSLTYKADFDKACLNRAQAYLQLAEYKSALGDYRHYLELDPNSPQKKEVEEIIRLLSQTLSDEERAIADKEAREKQLKDLLKSLEDAKDNSKNLSAGAEKLDEDYTEGDLMD